MPKCEKCGGAGEVESEDGHWSPCDCPAAMPAAYHVGGVEGEVTLAELHRHFLPGCSEPLRPGVDVERAENLPERKV